MKIRPMLGINASLKNIIYPVYASPKLDGVRAIITNEGVMSRSGKPIPNRYIQETFKQYLGFDGELIVGNPTDPNVFSKTTSGVMTQGGEPNVTLFVFDYYHGDFGIVNRYRYLINRGLTPDEYYKNLFLVKQTRIDNEEDLLKYETKQLAKGYEGVILRNPLATYKFGRSTVKEAGMLKIKRFVDSEAKIIGFEPLMQNNNEATIDELGYTKRSTSAEGKVAKDTLGNILVEDCNTGVQFSIGSGFDQEIRDWIWNNSKLLLGKLIKYKHFPVGEVDKPRFPVFLGFRAKEDMDGNG